MFTGHASSKDLRTARLDAEFYNPVQVENARKIEALRGDVLVSLCSRLLDHSFLSVRTGDYQESGVPFVRVKNLKGITLDEDFVFISAEANQREVQTICTPGDLLFAKTGKVAACPVPLHLSCVNTSQDVMVATVNNRADAYYVAAYLNCKHGALYQDRYVQGPVQPHLSLGNLKQIYIPLFHNAAQKYIGDKVRQAEGLRAFEGVLEQHIASLFQLAEWQGHRAGSRKTYQSAGADMTTERLDAPHYDPAHLHLGKILKRQNALPLSAVCAGVDERWHRREREFFYLEIGEIDLAAGRVSARRLSTNEAPSRAQRLVKPWDVVVATVRPNRKNVAIVSEVSENLPVVASTGFSVLRFQSDEAAAFYHAWLRSDVATQQLIQWSAGGAYPAIEEDIPLRILVPPFSDDVVTETGQKCKARLVAGEFAGKLCDTAKLLVEALIEGQIIEDELREAQQALDRGDVCPDQGILSRMTEHGIDCPGRPPLFPDLDALYAAIEDSESANCRNGEAT